jgi:excisionase family DNA binding protein
MTDHHAVAERCAFMSSNNNRRRADLVDITRAAERLGVSLRYMRRLVAERRVPYVKFGHLLRFDPVELEAWIDAARVGPGEYGEGHRSP